MGKRSCFAENYGMLREMHRVLSRKPKRVTSFVVQRKISIKPCMIFQKEPISMDDRKRWQYTGSCRVDTVPSQMLYFKTNSAMQLNKIKKKLNRWNAEVVDYHISKRYKVWRRLLE